MNKKVLITGGTSGIGREFVEVFAKNGFEVWFTYFSDNEKPVEVSKSYSQTPVTGFKLNLADYASVEALASALPSVPDVVIHNAGLGSKTVEKVSDTPHGQAEALIQVNAIGTLWLNNLLLPKMLERGSGKIILLSSVGGGVTQFPGFNYADGMSKAAIAFLGRTLGADLAQTGVDVFTICPGATNTPMFQGSTLNHLNAEQQKQVIASLPKMRLIDPREIAELGYFLTTDAGKILHGAVLDASMGLGVNPGLLLK
jgi:NAD(P)-dependent dehydrogenase (short-subunit alcohol dehydrogenase family)